MSAAPAMIVDSFSFEQCLWKATDIVLATEGDSIDGRFTAIEAWKGPIRPGTEIALPEMAAFADEAPRRVQYWRAGSPPPDPYVEVVTGSLVLLFLARADGAGPRAPAWRPAGDLDENGFRISAAWLEKGEAYAIQQVFSDTPGAMSHIGTVLEIRARAAAYTAIEAGLDEAHRTANPTMASQALRAFDGHALHGGANDAVKVLGEMGAPAAPVLRQLRGDPTLGMWHDGLLAALAAACGADAIPDVSAELQDGLAYWRERAPGLEKGWWNGGPAGVRQELRKRYSSLLAALRLAENLHAEACRDTIAELHTLWASHEALAEVGDNQMSRQCAAVLQELDARPGE